VSKKAIIILGHMTKPDVPQQIDELRPWFEQRVEVLGVQRADEACVDACPQADFAVVFGGDGTILHAARNLAQANVPLIGVNMGKLGFLAEFTVAELKEHFETILAGKVEPTTRMLLDVSVTTCEKPSFRSIAVNDVAIQAGAPFRMIDLNVEQDGGTISRYLGDGLVISTPTGSTAHNLSIGGPILEPTLDAVVITPLAPHTLALRPIVVRSDKTIRITAVKVNEGTTVIADGQATTALCEGATVDVRRSDITIETIPCPGRDVFRTLTNKLQWGLSPHHENHG
jgi:NAD+ kinase